MSTAPLAPPPTAKKLYNRAMRLKFPDGNFTPFNDARVETQNEYLMLAAEKAKTLHHKRPPNAYNLFMQQYSKTHKGVQKEVFADGASKWKHSSPTEKAKYTAMATAQREKLGYSALKKPKGMLNRYTAFLQENQLQPAEGAKKWAALSEAKKTEWSAKALAMNKAQGRFAVPKSPKHGTRKIRSATASPRSTASTPRKKTVRAKSVSPKSRGRPAAKKSPRNSPAKKTGAKKAAAKKTSPKKRSTSSSPNRTSPGKIEIVLEATEVKKRGRKAKV